VVVQNYDLMEQPITVQNVVMSTNKNIKRFCSICGSNNVRWILPNNKLDWGNPEHSSSRWLVVEDSKIAEQINKKFQINLNKKQNILRMP
jgi:hypothetical protein